MLHQAVTACIDCRERHACAPNRAFVPSRDCKRVEHCSMAKGPSRRKEGHTLFPMSGVVPDLPWIVFRGSGTCAQDIHDLSMSLCVYTWKRQTHHINGTECLPSCRVQC